MNILVISSLFPTIAQPYSGIFVYEQLMELSKKHRITVVNPIPFFPPIKYFKKWSRLSQVPLKEDIAGISVFHPRYLTFPRYILFPIVGITSYFISVRAIARKIDMSDVNLIHAHFASPDGFVTALIGKLYHKPTVLTVHGSDINVYTKKYLWKKQIVYALSNVKKVVCVSKKLQKKVVALGIEKTNTCVIPNGYNSTLFRPKNKRKIREVLNLPTEKKILLFVGNIVPIKGLSYLLRAMTNIAKKRQDVLLVIVGGGSQKNELERKTNNLGIAEYVKFVGEKPHREIPLWMNACNVFILPSLNEGFGGVLIEAMACGKPVVATNVGGIPENMNKDCGILVEPKDSDALADAILNALDREWNKKRILSHVKGYAWNKVVTNISNIYGEVCD